MIRVSKRSQRPYSLKYDGYIRKQPASDRLPFLDRYVKVTFQQSLVLVRSELLASVLCPREENTGALSGRNP